jgi:hypothetical protein
VEGGRFAAQSLYGPRNIDVSAAGFVLWICASQLVFRHDAADACAFVDSWIEGNGKNCFHLKYAFNTYS